MEKDKKKFMCISREKGYHYVEAKDRTEAQEMIWLNNFSAKVVGEVQQEGDTGQYTHE